MANRIYTQRDTDVQRYVNPVLANARVGEPSAMRKFNAAAKVLDPGTKLVIGHTFGIFGYIQKSVCELAEEWHTNRKGLGAIKNNGYRDLCRELVRIGKAQS